MKKRFIALLLSVVTLLSLAVPGVAAADESETVPGLSVTPVSVTLPQGGSTPLTVTNLPEGATARWQISANGLWVNISGETEATLTLTYAKVASLLDANGTAAVRCLADMNGTVVDESETIYVTVDYSAGNTTAPASGPVVLSGAKVISGPFITEPTVSAPVISAPVVPDTSLNNTKKGVGFAVGNPDPVAPGSPGYTPYSYTPTYDLGAVEVTPTPAPAVKHFVHISYVLDSNGTNVADPYTAQLAAGSDFSVTVAHPTVVGYLPYVDGVQTTSLSINITDIQQDVYYTVRYKPTNVDYTVIHHQQNVDNDNYTQVSSVVLQGLTGSNVGKVDTKYPGFYALLYEKPVIAADGSTVVEVYYDRYYYLLNFDLDGGYGVEPIYDRFGSPIGNVGTPTKPGYTFAGWTLDGTTTVDLPATMPAENRTYKALWDDDPTAKVTVVFWGQNANGDEYSYLKSAEVDAKVGMSFTYNENEERVCGLEEHAHSTSCGFKCGQTEHTHTVANNCYALTCTETSHSHAADNCTLSCTHTHGLECYTAANDTNLVETSKPNATLTHQGNGIYTYSSWGTHYYLNLGDEWYCADGAWGDRSSISFSCSHTTHDDACYTCGKVAGTHNHTVEGGCYELTCTTHTHSDACYNCGDVAHSHTSNCYMAEAGLDSNLWTFKESDTVTVDADGSTEVNVYYVRTQFTLTFRYSNTTLGTITDRWGANILTRFNEMCDAARARTSRYNGWADSTTGNYVDYIGIMPQMNKTLTVNTTSSSSQSVMTYYVEDLNGNDVELFKIQFAGSYNVTTDEYYEIEGFTIDKTRSTRTGAVCNGAKFYYTRNSYKLDFNDGLSVIKSESVKYQAPLGSYYFVPSAPDLYEPGSVQFAGWYLNPECSGDEYKLDEHTMSSSNLILYAKWVPVSHTVKFYLDEASLSAGTTLASHPDKTVAHGAKVDPAPADPDNGDYEFVGWFYRDAMGEEQAFDFANMAIKRDMQVYGKWSSNVLKNYFVYYKIKDTDTEIAKPTTGSTLAGETKTFDAKGGTELYEGYQEGYFPLTKSHSMTMDIENDENNIYVFEYVQKDAVPYIVRYVDEAGNELLAQKVVAGNRKAVVTENFEVVQGYMPDAYQKRLIVLGTEAEEWIPAEDENGNEVLVHPDNVITFVYVEDKEHAYYQITHLTENLDGTTWTEYSSSQAPGDIGQRYTGQSMNISGFTYKEVKYFVGENQVTENITEDGAVLTENGLQINLYYVRNSYPFEVRYLEEGSGKQLANPKTGTGKYGEMISESPITIAGYVPVDSSAKELAIRIEKSDTAQLNIITFYYREQEVKLNYEVVGPDGCGSVTPANESVKIKTGTALGSTATPNEGFRFMGWYEDKDCTKPVSTDNVNGNKFTPTKSGEVWTATTWYAKFEYDLTDLTIEKKYPKGKDLNQTAQFLVVTKNAEGEVTYRTTVIITGNGSATITGLKVGDTVTVTENNGWVWRYSVQNNRTEGGISANFTLVAKAADNKVIFENNRTINKWLSGENFAVNTGGSGITVTRGEGGPYNPAN